MDSPPRLRREEWIRAGSNRALPETVSINPLLEDHWARAAPIPGVHSACRGPLSAGASADEGNHDEAALRIAKAPSQNRW